MSIADLMPSARANVADSRFKIAHDIIKRKRGQFTSDEEDFIVVKAIYKEIPVFKDIPNQFKLQVTKFIF